MDYICEIGRPRGEDEIETRPHVLNMAENLWISALTKARLNNCGAE